MTEISYVSAPSVGWVLLCHGSTILMIDVPADSPLVSGLWALVSQSASPGQILDQITSGGISGAPSFMLVGASDSSATVLVRGALTVKVDSAAGVQDFSGAGVSSWVEQTVTNAIGFEGVIAADAAGPELPLSSGVTLASRFAVGTLAAHPGSLDATPAPAPAQPAVAATVVAAEQAAPEQAAPETVPEPIPAPVAAPAPALVPEPEPEAAHVVEPPATQISEATMVGQTVSAPPVAKSASMIVPPPSATGESAEDAGGDSYDYLFGETVFRKVEDAAVRVEADDEHSDHPAPAAGSTAASAPAEQAGDHDGHTMMVSDIAAMRAARRAQKQAAAEEAPAPSLYVDLSTGGREHLDQPLVIGRAPSATRVPGGKVPRLVSMSTPNQDISRTHAQLTVEGGTVVVTDLHSRNGTMVVLPGKPPQKLREGEPTAVIVGTVIDLGDGATLTVGEA